MTSHADESSRTMPIAPSMPDVAAGEPVSIWKAGDYLLVLFADLEPLSARIIGDASLTGLHYLATLAVIDRRSGLPQMYVTLEESSAGAFFCCFTEEGIHENLGIVDDPSVAAFTSKALDLFKKRFSFNGELTKAMPAQPAETSGPH
jgi:hypothetical protein